MKRFKQRPDTDTIGGYMLTELLVYIGLVGLVLGTGFAVMYRCVENTTVLRRNAEDVMAAVRAGERWRVDIRNAGQEVRTENTDCGPVMRLAGVKGQVAYRFQENSIFRQVQDRPWVRVLDNVKTSMMQADPHHNVAAWRWELELLPRAKGYNKPGKVRPLFTFIAVPGRTTQ